MYEPMTPEDWTAGLPLTAGPIAPAPPAAPGKRPSNYKRLVGAGLLALGMVAGGAAMVSAASPAPSASTAPSTSSGNGLDGSTAPSTTAPGSNAGNGAGGTNPCPHP